MMILVAVCSTFFLFLLGVRHLFQVDFFFCGRFQEETLQGLWEGTVRNTLQHFTPGKQTLIFVSGQQSKAAHGNDPKLVITLILSWDAQTLLGCGFLARHHQDDIR